MPALRRCMKPMRNDLHEHDEGNEVDRHQDHCVTAKERTSPSICWSRGPAIAAALRCRVDFTAARAALSHSHSLMLLDGFSIRCAGYHRLHVPTAALPATVITSDGTVIQVRDMPGGPSGIASNTGAMNRRSIPARLGRQQIRSNPSLLPKLEERADPLRHASQPEKQP